jgi:hypothetical protein
VTIDDTPRLLLERLVAHGHLRVNPIASMVTPEFMAEAHRLGVLVFAW